MPSEKKEKRKTPEIEHSEIQEIEHKTPHPEPDMTRNVTEHFSPGENDYLNEYPPRTNGD